MLFYDRHVDGCSSKRKTNTTYNLLVMRSYCETAIQTSSSPWKKTLTTSWTPLKTIKGKLHHQSLPKNQVNYKYYTLEIGHPRKCNLERLPLWSNSTDVDRVGAESSNARIMSNSKFNPADVYNQCITTVQIAWNCVVKLCDFVM